MQAKHSQICSVSRTCKRQNFQSSQEFWDRLGILAACSKMAYDKQICEAISVSFVIHCSSMQARLTSQKESYTANLPARRKLPGHFRTSFDEDCLELACRPSSGNIKNWSYGVRIGSSTRNAFRQGCVCALGLKGYAQNGEKRLGGPALGPGLQRYAATLRQGCNARTRYTAARRNSCMAAQRAARASSVVWRVPGRAFRVFGAKVKKNLSVCSLIKRTPVRCIKIVQLYLFQPMISLRVRVTFDKACRAHQHTLTSVTVSTSYSDRLVVRYLTVCDFPRSHPRASA